MQRKNKEIEKLLSELKSHCEGGDIRPLSEKISELMGAYFIRRLRECKMILLAPVKSRRDIALCLLSCARQLEQQEQDYFANYLEFSIAGDTVRRRLLKEMREKLSRMVSCCESDALSLAYEIYDVEIQRLTKYALSGIPSGKVAVEERRLHDLNGRIVDLSNGLARLLNEISRLELIDSSRRPCKRKERKRVLASMRRALGIAGQLNALEWLFDEVSFGHFIVAERGCDGFLFKLDFADAKMALMRKLAVRRSLIHKQMGYREERFIRNELNRIQEGLLEYALNYYSEVAGGPRLNSEDVDKARELARASLVIIDAEDDLLFAASKADERVRAYYVAGMALTCFSIAGKVVREAVRRNGDPALIMAIPLARIRDIFSIGSRGSLVAEGLCALTVTLPARTHSRLNALPFVRDGKDFAMPFLDGYSGMWNIMVRDALIKGGQLGKDVGAIWEEFLEHSFEDTSWRVIGKGVKLKKEKKIITDVDLLLLRNDLLLVVQIKALAAAADTPYDHWKNRQVVVKGCEQARTAVDFLLENTDTLVSICGKRVIEDIHVIQPVVLTNIHHLEGLSLFDVPVIAEATRKAICRGSVVDYIGTQGQQVHSHVFVPPEQLDTKVILRLLKEPVELRIASERPESVYREEQLGDLTFAIPEFVSISNPFQPPEL